MVNGVLNRMLRGPFQDASRSFTGCFATLRRMLRDPFPIGLHSSGVSVIFTLLLFGLLDSPLSKEYTFIFIEDIKILMLI
jgi:hypothetical protein